MGNPFLVQACLRLDKHEISHPLHIGKKYSFSKAGHRLYQLNVPMDLRTSDWKFIARIVITEYTLGNEKTEGTFVVVKQFTEEETEIITKTYVSDEEVKTILERQI